MGSTNTSPQHGHADVKLVDKLPIQHSKIKGRPHRTQHVCSQLVEFRQGAVYVLCSVSETITIADASLMLPRRNGTCEYEAACLLVAIVPDWPSSCRSVVITETITPPLSSRCESHHMKGSMI